MVERRPGRPRLRRRAHDAASPSWPRPRSSATDWDELERGGGLLARRDARRSREMLGEAERAVFVWSMGVTQHEHGEDNVRAIVNLALAQGLRGPRGLRADADPRPLGRAGRRGDGLLRDGAAGRAAGDRRRTRPRCRSSGASRCRPTPGLTAPEMLERRSSRCSSASGGNFLEVLPDPAARRGRRSARVPLRVHMDIVLSSQMLVEPADDGAAAAGHHALRDPGRRDRDEHRAAGDPLARGAGPADRGGAAGVGGAAGPGPARAARARRRAQLSGRHARAARGDRRGGAAVRAASRSCARAATRSSTAARACARAGDFPTPPTGAPTSAWSSRRRRVPDDGLFAVATRRGKQFNSMVQERQRRDHRRGARRGAREPRRRRAARDRRGRRGGACAPATASCAAARARADRAGQPPGALAGGQRADRRRPALAARPASRTTTRARAWRGAGSTLPA